MSYVLIVEDDVDIAELVRFHVQREGYRAEVVLTGEMAFKAIQQTPPRLLILDLMLPDVGGLEICRRVKADPATRQVPILIVSARGEESDIVAGLELGACDYVTKPFSPSVLMARMRNILRRTEEAAPGHGSNEGGVSRLSFGDEALIIDLDRHEVLVDAKVIDLTTSEFEILTYLAAKPGYARTRNQILQAVRGDHAVLSSRTIDVHVAALRKKLGDHGDLIVTVRGVGYRFAP